MDYLADKYRQLLTGKLFERRAINAVKRISDKEGDQKKSALDPIVRSILSGKLSEEVYRLRMLRQDDPGIQQYRTEYDALKKRYADTPAKQYSIRKWKTLSLFFIYNGMYGLGYICREKSKERLYCASKCSYPLILAKIEDGKLDEAGALADRLRNSRKGKYLKDELDLMDSFLCLLQGKEPACETDPGFSSYLKGKNVLIVGPTVSVNDLDSIPFIQSADLIVRNNVMLSRLPENLKIGISYCNGEGLRKMIRGEGLDAYEAALDWLVIKHEEKSVTPKEDKIHRAPDVSSLLYMGTANMLPLMVPDLAFHGVRDLYICGNNLFLTKQVHAADYALKSSKTIMTYGLVVHNLLSQHALLKLLYEHRLFAADEELDRVLKMSTMEYAEGMETIYR